MPHKSAARAAARASTPRTATPAADAALEAARSVLDKEIAGLRAVRERLDSSFSRVVDLVLSRSGRVVLTGVGKSGIVARKIAATLTSTGTRSLYLHPVDAAHGDMGILAPEDVLLVVSYSGANEELDDVLAACLRLRIPIVALTGNPASGLGRRSDIILDCRVPEEACPLNLAPTASTTAALAVGDALAVALLQKRGFGPDQFAEIHPSGVLGRRLVMTVADIMHTGDELPAVEGATTLREALVIMTRVRLGCVFVTDRHGRLTGIVTDGDLRRILARGAEPDLDAPVRDLMIPGPKSIEPGALALQALRRMEENVGGAITQLAVVDSDGLLVGAVHLHDIVRRGLSSAAKHET